MDRGAKVDKILEWHERWEKIRVKIMNHEITETIARIRALCTRSMNEGEFTYEHNDELHILCELLAKNSNYDSWAPFLYELIEEFDENIDLTLGSPGPLVHVLENTELKQFSEFLVASLIRRPTTVGMHMATTFAVHPDEDLKIWRKMFEDVLNHSKSTAGAKEIAKDALDNNFHQH